MSNTHKSFPSFFFGAQEATAFWNLAARSHQASLGIKRGHVVQKQTGHLLVLQHQLRSGPPPLPACQHGELQVSSLNADPHISEIESKKRTS